MRRVLVFVMVFALSAPASSVFAASPAQSAQAAATISGKATSSNGQALSNTSVRLRNIADGQLAGTTTTNAVGEFAFAALPAGNYIIEVVNPAGDIVGTSGMISLTAGASVAGVTISSAVALAAAGSGSFFASTAGLVVIAAAGAAIASVTVAANQTTASPSK